MFINVNNDTFRFIYVKNIQIKIVHIVILHRCCIGQFVHPVGVEGKACYKFHFIRVYYILV